MSKSLDFCLKIVKDPERFTLRRDNWEDAFERESQSVFDDLLNGIRILHLSAPNDFKLDLELNFCDDADFQYVTVETCLYDGTLLFVQDLMNKCAEKVCRGGTYFTPLGRPENGATVRYTIGNFVCLLEYDENGDKFTPKDKPWMRGRITVVLPLKVEYLPKENNK